MTLDTHVTSYPKDRLQVKSSNSAVTKGAVWDCSNMALELHKQDLRTVQTRAWSHTNGPLQSVQQGTSTRMRC